MHRYLILLLIFPLSILSAYSIPKRELRAAWISTVANIDWPSHKNLSSESQKQELINILDTLQSLKFNAAILQVKPSADAFYQSNLSPWSLYLTGTQGKDPGYDPLAFFITEAKKRTIETHIWVNPFRIMNKSDLSPLHIAHKHPDWIIQHDRWWYFDPGNPDVRDYIITEIMEIVTNYDIDVLHMDDYFYPPEKSVKGKIVFNDSQSWKKQKDQFPNQNKWRRENINIFIKTLSQKIKEKKHYVQFGISPFGVWQHQSIDPRGSKTFGSNTNYDDFHADVLHWIDCKWIDYIMPQIYWNFNTPKVPFDILVDWWDKKANGTINMYIGIALYKLAHQNWIPNYIKKQVTYTRQKPNIEGISYFSVKYLMQNTKNILSVIQDSIYPTEALCPLSKTIKGAPPLETENFELLHDNEQLLLTWENKDPDNTSYFVIYRFIKDTIPDISNPRNILCKVSSILPSKYILHDHKNNHTYGITAVSRLHIESSLVLLEDNNKKNGFYILDQLLEKQYAL